MVAMVCGIFFGTLLGIIAGLAIGFIATKKYYDKSLKENPPITEEQIRIMFSQMGRKPTEKQVRQIMYSMKNPKK
ncbi:YneF family protein [bacterium]|nr:YneF family protein [bacterium]MBQ5492949.1 YneF family protein [Mycoplasmataceae bacterium]MBO6023209.1 YneF family protein [bacterium]MBO6042303.1 YneF family protein [bacterium]MBO6072832.1 YneF family protein [bacterium]